MLKTDRTTGEIGMSDTREVELPLVKNLILPIATSAGAAATSGAWLGVQVDAEVSKWIERGYKLITAFPYANAPEYVQVLYVLAKQ